MFSLLGGLWGSTPDKEKSQSPEPTSPEPTLTETDNTLKVLSTSPTRDESWATTANNLNYNGSGAKTSNCAVDNGWGYAAGCAAMNYDVNHNCGYVATNDETDSLPDLIEIEEVTYAKNALDIVKEITTDLVTDATSDAVDTVIANMENKKSLDKIKKTAEKILDGIILEAANRAEVNKTVQKSLDNIVSEAVAKIETNKQQESIDLERIAFNALKTLKHEETQPPSLERLSLDALGAIKAHRRSVEYGESSFEFAEQEQFDELKISYEPIKQLRTQYRLHEYFKNTNNFTRSAMENELQYVAGNNFCDKNSFKLVGTGSVAMSMTNCSKAKIKFCIKHLKNKGNYFLSNIRISQASMKQFKEMQFHVNGCVIDTVNNGSFDITNSYANIGEDYNSFQVPFSGTYNNNHMYMNDDTNYYMCIEADPHKPNNEERLEFFVMYDIYEGAKPNSGDVFDIFQHQTHSEIMRGGYFAESNKFSLKNKVITYFDFPVLGFNIRFDEGELLDLVESVKLRFKGQWNYEHVEEFDVKTLKEFKGTFGEGIIPFVPKFQTKADSIRHSINCSTCDVFVIEFDFIDPNVDHSVEIHALNYNVMEYNLKLQPELMYSN